MQYVSQIGRRVGDWYLFLDTNDSQLCTTRRHVEGKGENSVSTTVRPDSPHRGIATCPSSTIPARFHNASQYARHIQVRPIWCSEDLVYVGHCPPGLVYNIQCQAPIRTRNCLFRPRARSAPCISS
jgi:hypothetical protein